jgi:hypothetical protein
MSEEQKLFWEAGFEGHEIAQRRRMAELAFEEKLEWLDQPQRIVDAMKGNKGFVESRLPRDPKKSFRSG